MTATRRKSPRASRTKKRISLVINVLLFAIALGVLHKILTDFKFDEIMSAIRSIPLQWIGAGLGLTVLGYGALIGYDYLSLKAVGKPVELSRMWLPSYVSHAVQNSAPVAIVAGGGVRYKLFRRLGLTPAQIGSVVGANLITFLLGLFAVAGLSFVLAPVPIPQKFHLPLHSLRPVGFVFLALVIAAALFAEFRDRPVHIGKHRLDLPGGGLVRLQLGVSSADWLLSSTALYVLLLGDKPVSYLHFLTAFLLAQIVTQVVPLPGGVGVFEAAVLLMRPASVSVPKMTAALVLYRVIYYLIPLIFAAGFLTRQASVHPPRGATAPVWRFARKYSPHLLAVLTFITGAVLLSAGALASHGGDVSGWLQRTLPDAIVQVSRFVGSLIGFGLLVLAWGLERKIYGAYRLTIWLLGLAIPIVLFRSSDLVSAGLLLLMLFVLLLGRAEFTRRTPLTAERFDLGWVAATVGAVGVVFAMALFARSHGEYASIPWWRLAFDPMAPGGLRLAVPAVMVFAIVVGARLVGRAHHVGRPHRVNRRSAGG